MEPRVARAEKGHGAESHRRLEEIVSPPRPLLRPAPRSAMFFPLVVLVAVLPGLYALNWWDLNPPGPWWGLRGLAVLYGHALDQVSLAGLGPAVEADAYRAVALQPPLYAWLEAVGLALSRDHDPLATVLPSYAAGALVVILVYFHGRLWRGPGLGLVAALLTGFNRDLLLQMQQASPRTLGLAWMLASLLCYGQYQRDGGRRRWVWPILGGLSMGLALLSAGLFGLLVVPIVLLHQMYIGADVVSTSRRPGVRRRRSWLASPGLLAGIVALCLGLALAMPWYTMMLSRHGIVMLEALTRPSASVPEPRRGLVFTLLALAPATLPLALYGAGRALRRGLAAEPDEPAATGGALWLVWLSVAALAPTLWPDGLRIAPALLMLVPLNLLAAQAVTDLASRRASARTLVWLAPATAATVTWWISSDLRHAVNELLRGQRPDLATILGLHLALDAVLLSVVIARGLDRWVRRNDVRRRSVLGAYLLLVATLTVGAGLREVRFRHSETAELLDLREAILRRNRIHPFELVAVVGPDPTLWGPHLPPPGGRLRFLLRSTLPKLCQIELTHTDDLLGLPDGQRLVILVGNEHRLSYAVQSRLNLEEIHPNRSRVLEAYATTYLPEQRVVGRR